MKSTNLKTFTLKSVCSILVISVFAMSPSFAYYPRQNHVYTTTTTEKYASSSPVGKFENNSTQGAVAPIYTMYNNYSPYPMYAPQPMYTSYSNEANNQNLSMNDNKDPAVDYTGNSKDSLVEQTTIASAVPLTYGYGTPLYTAGIGYANPNYSSNSSSQDIETPQSYEKTVTTTQEYVDTRERADKIIDRGAKVFGALALVGAATGLILYAVK